MESKGEFDVLTYMMPLTLETIIKFMEYDVDIQNQEREIRDGFKHSLKVYSKLLIERVMKLWLYPDFIYTRTSFYEKYVESIASSCMKFADDIIKNARRIFEADESGTTKKEKSFIRALINPKNNFSDSEIRDEIKSIMIPAQETTSLASSTALLMLAMHKDVQKKVVDELHMVFGKVTEAPFIEIDVLNELVYLDMVINEILRLFPSIPFIFRTVTEEIEISDGYILPVDTRLVAPIFILHRLKTFWGEDAEKFRPERFESKNFEKIEPYAFLPFGKGSRNCIGWRYSGYLMKITLVNFLLRYEVDTDLKYEDLDFELRISLSISQGYKISIKERIN